MVKDSLQRVYTEGESGDLEDENGVGESESPDEGSGELSTYHGTVSESTFSEETQGNQLANMLEELVQAGEEDEPNAEPEEENLRLGPETAFLAEGSVHDTGGMVEWAGTVKDHQR